MFSYPRSIKILFLMSLVGSLFSTAHAKGHELSRPDGLQRSSPIYAIGECKFRIRLRDRDQPHLFKDEQMVGWAYWLSIEGVRQRSKALLTCISPLSELTPDVLGKAAGIVRSSEGRWILDPDSSQSGETIRFYPLQGTNWSGGATSGGSSSERDRYLSFCLVKAETALCGSLNESEQDSSLKDAERVYSDLIKTVSNIEFVDPAP